MAFKPVATVAEWDKSAEKGLPALLVDMKTSLVAFELRLKKVTDKMKEVEDPDLEHTRHQLLFLLAGCGRVKAHMPILSDYVKEQSKNANPRRRNK